VTPLDKSLNRLSLVGLVGVGGVPKDRNHIWQRVACSYSKCCPRLLPLLPGNCIGAPVFVRASGSTPGPASRVSGWRRATSRANA
jgi:hypothetical protein